jgi:PST family polysaccharide transporter
MGADFYPRLTACAKDNAACNRLVNEQALVGLLLAGPGVITTLTFAPLVISFFYSVKFGAAVAVLRWICLGTTLQVITWPMGFIIVAKAQKGLFFFAELAWTVVAIALAWICVRSFGLNGAGIAFFGSYVFHAILIYMIVGRLSRFCWSAENLQTGMFFLSLIAGVFCAASLLPVLFTGVVGTVASILSGVYSIRALLRLSSLECLPNPVRRFATSFGLVSSSRCAVPE